ncbi:hypothetical protein [Kitasatospora sp. NPDC056184]|uniref:hypothetical protein n=1 Tax=Kitasatospora sp. NPDC056184 TaxID=3345738 RepID=UPI0035D6035D
MQQRVRDYTRQAITDEWEQMGRGRGSAEAWAAADRIRTCGRGAEPGTRPNSP